MITAESAGGQTERLARVAWSRIAEPGDSTAADLIARWGAVEALERVRQGAADGAQRFQPRLAMLDVERDIEVAAKYDARVVCPGDAEWPAGLDDLHRRGGAPFCLWVRGPMLLWPTLRRSLAVVGARNATSYGQMISADVAAALAQRDFAIVSGAAFGIDAAAHRGVLAVDGTTIAVMAGGVERPYPAAHSGLIAEIARRGAVVSEVPPGSAPTRWRFLQRNRLIAAMSRATAVVEAGLRSGSLNTARTAAELGRVVMAFPGPVTSMMSAGCHELIRSGRAQLVTDAAEAGEAAGDYGIDLAPSRRGEVRPVDSLHDDELRVLSALPVRRGEPTGKIAVAAGVGAAQVLALLGRLELLGLAERDGLGWRKSKAARR